MRFRLFFAALLCCLLYTAGALADAPVFDYLPQVFSPGKAERVTVSLSAAGTLTLEVLTEGGEAVLTLRRDASLSGGAFTTTFNACDSQGVALPQGRYLMRATANGESTVQAFDVGEAAPQILSVALTSSSYSTDEALTLSLSASMDGTLHTLLIDADGTARQLPDVDIPSGQSELSYPIGEEITAGSCSLSLTLTSDSGLSSNSYQLPIRLIRPTPVPTETPVPTPTPIPTPRPQPTVRPSQLAEETISGDYWSMELGNYDWEAIWQVMISPMTVISGSGKEAEKQTYRLRATPDKSTELSNVVGQITCETQGVHVLETLDNGWTLVEAYNSSYGDAYRKAGKGAGYGVTDELIQGYVETDRLTLFTPRTEYGLLIDKMTQELYIVTEEGLLTTLKISTGKVTSSQPWNETPAGEFYLSSKVGDFPSGNLTCAYGMRFNNGDILHEVPYILNEKYNLKDYSSTEKYLGEKASHGCVRVQRQKNDDDVNMKWIWDNVPLKTKLLIWDDDGRPEPYMEYPIPLDMTLYYNPDGGKYYHADQNCSSIKNRYLPLKGSLTYAELDDAQYSYLTPCAHCDPPALRPSEIDAINAANGY